MKSEERRNQILNCAKKVFARHGYHKTNITMICEKAGIGRGTLYLYFKNKEAVFSAILEKIFDRMIHELSDFTKTSFENKEELFEAHAEAIERGFMVWLVDRDFARIFFEMSLGVSKQFTDMRLKFDLRSITLIKSRIENWKKAGFVSKDLDTELAAIKLHGGMEKIITTYLFNMKKKLSNRDIKELVHKVARLNFYGLSG